MDHTRAVSIESSVSQAGIVEAFHCARGLPDFSIADFWRTHGSGRKVTVLSSLIKIDLQIRFERGETPAAEEYLETFPELAADPDRALSLIYEEFCLLEENDRGPSVDEFVSRYKPWRDSLASQLAYHREFSQIVGADRPKVRYPAVGDRFASYKLRSLLGKGGAAQVYLATDDLGGRNVVLKVSPSIGLEPSILASLEHRNIVSIFTVVESPELGLRGICMPYKSGITLEALMEDFAAGSLPRKALSVWKRLEIDRADPDLVDQGWKDFPVHGTYSEAVAWIGLMIINALDYLHRRQIFHRDIKPANILLTHSEGPLLFDFNLAHCPNAPEFARDAMNGGTLPYMAPEQLRAFIDPEAWGRVGARADIYALGLVLRELVTGSKPDLPNKDLPLGRAIQDLHDRRHDLTGSTRLIRPDLPPALDAIIAKCLCFRPEDRFATAREVGDDLRRFLDRKPLLVAPNGSTLELVANWIYRRRKAIAAVGLVLGCCGLILATRLIQPGPAGGRPSGDGGATVGSQENASSLRMGVALLDSPDRESWRQAEMIFRRLAQLEPGSAWPLLYQSLCLQKLDGVDNETAKELFKAAARQPNFPDAINHRRTVEPRSILLIVALGQFYLDKKEIRSAQRVADEAARIDASNGSILALRGNVALADLALRGPGAVADGRRSEAIADFMAASRAIATKDPSSPTLKELTKTLVLLLIAEVDGLSHATPDVPRCRELEGRLQQLDDQLAAMGRRHRQDVRDRPDLWTDLSITIGQANLNSGLGYLHAARGDRANAVEEFSRARQLFRAASDLAENKIVAGTPNQNKFLSSNLSYISNAKQELAQRMRWAKVADDR